MFKHLCLFKLLGSSKFCLINPHHIALLFSLKYFMYAMVYYGKYTLWQGPKFGSNFIFKHFLTIKIVGYLSTTSRLENKSQFSFTMFFPPTHFSHRVISSPFLFPIHFPKNFSPPVKWRSLYFFQKGFMKMA